MHEQYSHEAHFIIYFNSNVKEFKDGNDTSLKEQTQICLSKTSWILTLAIYQSCYYYSWKQQNSA